MLLLINLSNKHLLFAIYTKAKQYGYKNEQPSPELGMLKQACSPTQEAETGGTVKLHLSEKIYNWKQNK